MKKIFTLPFLLMAFISSGSVLTGQICMPCQINAPWQHSKAIIIDNSTNTNALTNYQVLLTIDTQTPIGLGEMNPDGSDVRFSTDCSNDLYYWIESGINTASTQIWVKVPSVASNSIDTVYMIYGNSAATAVSNADSTFDLYDTFDGSSLDLTKWEVRGVPIYTVSGGELYFSGNSNWEYIRSNVNFTQPVVIEENHSNVGPSFGLVLGYTGTDSRYTFREGSFGLGCTYDPDVSGGNAWLDDTYPGVPLSYTPVYSDYSVVAGMNATVIQVQEFCNISTSNCNNVPTDLNTFNGSSFYVGFSSYSAGYEGYVRSIRVRKHSAILPTITLENVAQHPVVDLGVDFSVCADSLVTLDAGNAGATYVWNNLSTNQTLNVNTAGTYHVTVTNGASCSATDSVAVGFNPLPVVNLGVDTTICNGSSLLLNAQNTGADYLWSNNATSQTISVSTPGNYSVIVTNSFGCENTDTLDLNVFTIDNTTTTNSLTITSNAAFANYQWLNCSNNQPIAGETNMSYTAAINGSYAVIISQMGCTDTSACVSINSVGVENNEVSEFHIYPNPSNGSVFVEVTVSGKYQVIDMMGKIISIHQLYSGTPNLLELQHILPGVYFIQKLDEGSSVGKGKIVISK